MKLLLIALSLVPSLVFAGPACQNPVSPSGFDFSYFQYQDKCDGVMLVYNELDDKILDPKDPSGHDYVIAIQLYADHTAYVDYHDELWQYNIGIGYTFWNQFKTTWTSTGDQISIDKVGTGTAVQCSNLSGTALNFAYDQSLQGLLAGTNRLVQQAEDSIYPSRCGSPSHQELERRRP